MKSNVEGSMARSAVSGLSSKNILPPSRRLLTSKKARSKKEKPEKPLKVASERVTEPPVNVRSERVTKEQDSGPINVRSERINTPQEAIGRGSRELPAPPTKKESKPRKPRDVKYTQPTLPGMRNTRQFKGKSGKV
jgi:hypothetical protein